MVCLVKHVRDSNLRGLPGSPPCEARRGFKPQGYLHMWITSREWSAASRTQTSEGQTNTRGCKAHVKRVFTSGENGNGNDDDIDTNSSGGSRILLRGMHHLPKWVC